MNRRPNPVSHMASWGAISGFILSLSYLVVLLDIFSNSADPSALLLFVNPFAWWLGVIYGAVPGAIIGSIVAVALWWMMKDVSLPFHKEDMLKKRPQVYSIIFLATFGLSLWMIFLTFGSLIGTGFLVLPPFIAAIASTYAAHRYLFRMRLWSGGRTTSRKSKAKNEAINTARLEQAADDDEDARLIFALNESQLEQRS